MADSSERRKRINFRKSPSLGSKPLIPEMAELIKKKELGEFGNFIDGILPLPLQRALASMFPGNQTLQRLQALNDYRQEHNIKVSRLPI
jgi:hypothetical protein